MFKISQRRTVPLSCDHIFQHQNNEDSPNLHQCPFNHGAIINVNTFNLSTSILDAITLYLDLRLHHSPPPHPSSTSFHSSLYPSGSLPHSLQRLITIPTCIPTSNLLEHKSESLPPIPSPPKHRLCTYFTPQTRPFSLSEH